MALSTPTDAMRDWVEGLVGSPITSIKREFAGGSRPLWYVTTEPADYVLRLDTGRGAMAGSIYGVNREVDVYRALSKTTIAAPRLLGTQQFSEGFAILMTRVPGDSRLPRGDDERALTMIDALVCEIASLHQLDAARLDLQWGNTPSMREAVKNELNQWRSLAGDSPRPECSYAITWLEDKVELLPNLDRQAVLVQGDTGPGNAVFDAHRLTALVDWELAHFGDPMEDLAWIDQRCQQWDQLEGARMRRYLAYESTGADPIVQSRIDYHAVFVRLRCAIITARTIAAGDGALGLAVYHPAQNRFNRDLVDFLFVAEGLTPPDRSAIDAQIKESIGFDQDAFAALVASQAQKRPVDSAERLAHREQSLIELHEWMIARYDTAIRNLNPVDFDSIAMGAELNTLAALALAAARAELMWPDPAFR